jgi:hypothetical protein
MPKLRVLAPTRSANGTVVRAKADDGTAVDVILPADVNPGQMITVQYKAGESPGQTKVISARYCAKSGSASAVRAGYLQKLSSGHVRRWQKRYFVLGDDYWLRYKPQTGYKKEQANAANATNMKAMISLRDVQQVVQKGKQIAIIPREETTGGKMIQVPAKPNLLFIVFNLF